MVKAIYISETKFFKWILTDGRVSVLKEPKSKTGKKRESEFEYNDILHNSEDFPNTLSDGEGIISLQNHKLIWSKQNNYVKAQNT